MALDITADQYNLLDDKEINNEIIKNRPFDPVYWGEIGLLPQYKIFKIHEKEKLIHGFPNFHEDFTENLIRSYELLLK